MAKKKKRTAAQKKRAKAARAAASAPSSNDDAANNNLKSESVIQSVSNGGATVEVGNLCLLTIELFCISH